MNIIVWIVIQEDDFLCNGPKDLKITFNTLRFYRIPLLINFLSHTLHLLS